MKASESITSDKFGACIECRDSFARATVPINPAVAGACEILPLDPPYVANEGKLVAAVS